MKFPFFSKVCALTRALAPRLIVFKLSRCLVVVEFENLDLSAPPDHLKDRLLEVLTTVENQGDSHIRLLLKAPEWYVTPAPSSNATWQEWMSTVLPLRRNGYIAVVFSFFVRGCFVLVLIKPSPSLKCSWLLVTGEVLRTELDLADYPPSNMTSIGMLQPPSPPPT